MSESVPRGLNLKNRVRSARIHTPTRLMSRSDYTYKMVTCNPTTSTLVGVAFFCPGKIYPLPEIPLANQRRDHQTPSIISSRITIHSRFRYHLSQTAIAESIEDETPALHQIQNGKIPALHQIQNAEIAALHQIQVLPTKGRLCD